MGNGRSSGIGACLNDHDEKRVRLLRIEPHRPRKSATPFPAVPTENRTQRMKKADEHLARRPFFIKRPCASAYFNAPATFFCRHRHSKSHATCAAAIAVISA